MINKVTINWIPGSSCMLPTTIGAVTRILLTGGGSQDLRTISEEEGDFSFFNLPRNDNEVILQKKEKENITRGYTREETGRPGVR